MQYRNDPSEKKRSAKRQRYWENPESARFGEESGVREG